MNKKASFFQELLIGIYKSDRIKYEQKHIYIEGKSLYGKCDFEKTDKYVIYRAWFNELFRLTFLDEETEFSIDREGGSYNIDTLKKGQVQFTRKGAIINTVLFLKKHGVDFNILTNKDVTEVENIKMIIYTSLWIVTSYIFNTVGCDIEKDFRIMINSINLYLCKESFSVSSPCHTTEENSVVERSLSKRECNRYVCVRNEDVGIPRIVSFTPVSANIFIINRKERQKENSKDTLFLDWLMSGLGVYDPMKDEVIETSSYSQPSVLERVKELPEPFHISHIYPDAHKVNSFKIYYLCSITPDKIRTLFPDASDPHTLRKMIIAKDKERLASKFQLIVSAYCEEVMRYIEDVLDRIIAMDLERLITGDIDADIIFAFNIDYDKVISFLKENGVLNNKDSYLYLMIDRAIRDFIYQINFDTAQLVNMICTNVNKDCINMHIKKLKELVSSDKIRTAVIVQEEDQIKNPDNYYTNIGASAWSNESINLYTKRVKGSFSSLRGTIEKYVSYLSKALNN